jgi:hypothetical protein
VEDTVSGRLSWRERAVGHLLTVTAQAGDVILFAEVSRMARSTLQVLETLEHCIQQGVHVHIAKQRMVLDGSMPSRITATVLGLAKVVSQEYPWLRCRTVDVVPPEPETSREVSLAECLIAEATSVAADAAIAYRGSNRWVQTHVSVGPLTQPAPVSPLLRDRGVYLVTGGLGGVGLAIAGALADTVSARLVLVGRTPLPPRSEWDAWLVANGVEDPVSRRILGIRGLEARGAFAPKRSIHAPDGE